MISAFHADKKPTILVVGDLMMDHYIWGGCERISPEAPVQVIDVKRESKSLGGACNVMNNLIALDSCVIACGVIGKDSVGEELLGILRSLGIKENGIVVQSSRPTTKKSRIIASNQQVVRVDWESKGDICAHTQERLLEVIHSNIDKCDIVILSDYGKGVLTPSLTQTIIKEAKNKNKRVLVDPKGKDYAKYRGASLLTPNKKEVRESTGIEIGGEESLREALCALKEMCALEFSVITLSEDGIAIFENDVERIPTIAREVYDVTGAGDTVIASLAYGLASGFPLRECALFANAAAAVVVGKIGSATATHEEIAKYLHAIQEGYTQARVLQKEAMQKVVESLRLHGQKVVFTNGCFDILHAGHVQYLQKAKELGDCLIVGLNSDDSVQRLKGEGRPINSEQDRALVLAALESVDYVVIFSEDTPYELIQSLKPDVLVKGKDYEGKEVVGSELVKEVRLIEFLAGRSTSNIVKKIKG